MTSRPRLHTSRSQVVGLVAFALFGVLAAVFLTADFGATFGEGGFPDGSITASIGYAMFNLAPNQVIPSEGFLVPFEIIDVVLVAALAAAVMLGRREREEGFMPLTDGGERSQERRDPSDATASGDAGGHARAGGRGDRRPASGDEGGDR